MGMAIYGAVRAFISESGGGGAGLPPGSKGFKGIQRDLKCSKGSKGSYEKKRGFLDIILRPAFISDSLG